MTLTKASLGRLLNEETFPYELNPEWERVVNVEVVDAAGFVERLLPEKCEPCQGHGVLGVHVHTDERTGAHLGDEVEYCKPCHGTGQLWDEGLVEEVARALCVQGEGHLPETVESWGWPEKYIHASLENYREQARAVLAALTQEVGK